MKINKLYTAIALIGSLILTSCKEMLEVSPDHYLGKEEAYTIPEAQLNGIYYGMIVNNYYGRNFYQKFAVGSDNIVKRRGSSWANIHNMDKGSGEADMIYTQAYDVLVNIHHLLANEQASDEEKGQAYFMRAFVYFDLVRTFGQVPLVTEVLPYDAKPSNTDNSELDIYGQVEKDLDEALKLISNTTDKSKASVDAIHALRTRVFLYKADEYLTGEDQREYYQKVVDEAELINGTLTEAKDYFKYFQENGGEETILEFLMVQGQGGNDTDDHLGSRYSPNKNSDDFVRGQGYWTANPAWVSSWHQDDVRRSIVDSTLVSNEPGSFFIIKFTETDGEPFLHSPKVLRYAEVLLNKAEALYKLERTGEAALEIDKLRAERYLPSDSAPKAVGDIDEILEERRKELAFEGHRIFDLRRNRREMVLVEAEDEKKNAEIKVRKTVPAGDKNFWWPLAEAWTSRNPNLINTKGY
ncbi:RagB/SusD family nutrient uptake outer membrane protein [Xanthovirga aplysinae]|uniref:RagB/SusD family nutrient uptake outer membrane protein n=1 Tax=Xanthovirga aplysinae TaxID=2529853 RepID=UPI0012BC0DC8|nr:RagB/SusD family nutrient uptake outer membrane protein [Xanthovirga aplysinae]MTI30505.1 RagB/SusD family nutrient uptake outer membrane protein [Xanthovirga aplysinae]